MQTLITAFVLLVPCAVHAQNFAIDWFTIDGGGGTSTAASTPSAAPSASQTQALP